MPRMSKQLVGSVSRSAKSVLADGCPAYFWFALKLTRRREGLKRHAGYVCQDTMHGDVQAPQYGCSRCLPLHDLLDTTEVLRSQLTEAEHTNTRLTEQVAEICAGWWLSADSAQNVQCCCIVESSLSHYISIVWHNCKPAGPAVLFWHCDICGVVCSCIIPTR